MRKPLIELHELHEYASKMKRRKWGTKFYNAAQLVTGIAASPLEVAAILLLSLPRSRGGAGFRNVYVNDLTPLTASAQSIAGQKSLLRGYRDRESNHNEGRHRGDSGRGHPRIRRRARPRCQTNDGAAKYGVRRLPGYARHA